jgi:serine/threonine protein kinase
MADSLIGKTLGKYQIVELIGRGARAEVYKAYQASLDRHVAIKLLHSFLAEDKNFLARFQREAKSAAQLRHPNIVQTYDFDVTDGVCFYVVMEYINGYTLDAKLQELTAQNEIMPLPEAIRIFKDVASALSYANSHGMVHRDIKPSNVMLNQDRHVILTDLASPRFSAMRVTPPPASSARPTYITRTRLGQGSRRAQRPVFAGGHVLSDGDRPASLPGGCGRGDLAQTRQ